MKLSIWRLGDLDRWRSRSGFGGRLSNSGFIECDTSLLVERIRIDLWLVDMQHIICIMFGGYHVWRAAWLVSSPLVVTICEGLMSSCLVDTMYEELKTSCWKGFMFGGYHIWKASCLKYSVGQWRMWCGQYEWLIAVSPVQVQRANSIANPWVVLDSDKFRPVWDLLLPIEPRYHQRVVYHRGICYRYMCRCWTWSRSVHFGVSFCCMANLWS